MKPCIICNEQKPLDAFYKHKRMGDGHLNKCKECCKRQSKEREEKLKQQPDWVEKEKARAREKYHRLGYKEKHKPSKEDKKAIMAKYKDKYPEKSLIRNRCTEYIKAFRKTNPNKELHHWSYNLSHAKDCIPLTIKEHNFIHRFLQYDQSTYMYADRDGNLLDTKQKHEQYIQKLLSDMNNF